MQVVHCYCYWLHYLGEYYYSIYRRGDGFWYLDSNEISEDYDGSISYSANSNKITAEFPWETDWIDGVIVLMTETLMVFGGTNYTEITNGVYHFDRSSSPSQYAFVAET
jgi:hypothetical protein